MILCLDQKTNCIPLAVLLWKERQSMNCIWGALYRRFLGECIPTDFKIFYSCWWYIYVWFRARVLGKGEEGKKCSETSLLQGKSQYICQPVEHSKELALKLLLLWLSPTSRIHVRTVYFWGYSGGLLIQYREIDSFMWLADSKATNKAVFQPVLSVNKLTWACTNKCTKFRAVLVININHLEKFLSKQGRKVSSQQMLTKVEWYIVVNACILGNDRGWDGLLTVRP